MITIGNNGQELAETNYWDSEHASAGFCYLSANAGALRLLVPEAAEGLLAEMRTGKRVLLEPSISSPGCIDIVFDDGTDEPFALAIDRQQIDRALTPATNVRFVIWTQRGPQAEFVAVIK